MLNVYFFKKLYHKFYRHKYFLYERMDIRSGDSKLWRLILPLEWIWFQIIRVTTKHVKGYRSHLDILLVKSHREAILRLGRSLFIQTSVNHKARCQRASPSLRIVLLLEFWVNILEYYAVRRFKNFLQTCTDKGYTHEGFTWSQVGPAGRQQYRHSQEAQELDPSSTGRDARHRYWLHMPYWAWRDGSPFSTSRRSGPPPWLFCCRSLQNTRGAPSVSPVLQTCWARTYPGCSFPNSKALWTNHFPDQVAQHKIQPSISCWSYPGRSSPEIGTKLSTSSPKLRTQAASSGSLLVVISSNTPPSSCSTSCCVSDQMRSRT